MLTNRRIRLYNAPNLHEHVLNAASAKTSRDIRLAKEKQSIKIDGAVALSLCGDCGGESGRPMSPEEFRALPPITTVSTFDVRRVAGFDSAAGAVKMIFNPLSFYEWTTPVSSSY